MDALISGEAGVALLIDGAALRSLGLGAAAQSVHRRREDAPFILGDARDLQVLENVTEREVAARLESAAARIDGLQLILILLDPMLAADTRQEAAAEAEELLAQGGTAEAVESILYAHPLPATADPAGALHACANRARAAQLVRQLVARQPMIALVHQAWVQVLPAVFGTPEDREHVQAVFVREGLFRSFVLARESRQPVDAFLLGALLNPEVKRLARHRAILNSWIEPFEEGHKRRSSKDQSVETADIVAEEMGPSYRRGLDQQKQLANVHVKKTAIVSAMEAGDLKRALRDVDDLVQVQTVGGQDPRFVCISLCDLAIKAKSLELPNLQLELSRRATKLKEDDAWSWVQYADALLDTDRPGEALAAAENGIAFGEVVAGKTVLAEVLRALGRPNEPTNDMEVISRYLKGDAKGVEIVNSWIARAAWPYQRRLASRWEDVLQDVQLEVIRVLHEGRFRGHSSLRTFLWQVVSHACLDHLHSRGRWQRGELETLGERATPPATGSHEDRDLVQRVLGRVSNECRELWRLIAMGHSYREMSDRLGVAEATLRLRQLRCRKRALALRGELLGGRPPLQRSGGR